VEIHLLPNKPAKAARHATLANLNHGVEGSATARVHLAYGGHLAFGGVARFKEGHQVGERCWLKARLTFAARGGNGGIALRHPLPDGCDLRQYVLSGFGHSEEYRRLEGAAQVLLPGCSDLRGD